MAPELDRSANQPSTIRVACFVLLLAPISIMVAQDGVSANYAFAILILFAPLGYRANHFALVYLAFMVMAWAVGMLQFSEGDGIFLTRQSVSFALALAGVLLLFVRLPFSLADISTAIVVVSVLYSGLVFWTIATQGVSLIDVYFVKGALREFVPDWPQRYVIVLIPALFIAFDRLGRGPLWPMIALAILGCVFLTFTRAAWIGILLGAFAFALAPKNKSSSLSETAHKSRRLVAALYVALFAVSGVVAARSEVVVNAMEVLWSNMNAVFSIVATGDRFETGSSEGTRLELWAQMFDALARNPISGTGFAGVYLVVAGTDSAHSQYMDVLLRTGFVGLAFYVYFWSKALQGYWRRDRAIFAGLIALFVFGFFHETTKLSYGALLFFALLNKVYESERDTPPARAPAPPAQPLSSQLS